MHITALLVGIGIGFLATNQYRLLRCYLHADAPQLTDPPHEKTEDPDWDPAIDAFLTNQASA